MTDDNGVPARKAIPRRLRFEILRRDGHTCRYCGGSAPDVKLTVDHVIPVALGGSDDPSNLVTACVDCNSGKSSVAPDQAVVEDVDATAFLLADALERASERRRAELADSRAVIDTFDAIWCGWTTGSGERVPRDHNWRASVERFLANGLNMDELRHYVSVAMDAKVEHEVRFRYFCGCCWKEIGVRQEMARQIIEDEALVDRGQQIDAITPQIEALADSLRLTEDDA